MKASRTQLNLQISTIAQKNGSAVTATLEKECKDLEVTDPSIDVERSFFKSMAGNGGAICMKELFRTALGVANCYDEISKIDVELKGLLQGDMFRFCDDTGNKWLLLRKRS